MPLSPARRQTVITVIATLCLVLGCAGIIIGGVIPWKVRDVFPTTVSSSIEITGNRLWQAPQISQAYVPSAPGEIERERERERERE